ncbi:glutaredoxin-C9-like [Chenopodium quinoa]|uniref:glutaredoxin-C9-like n=1 Tax=Chenopodium quinoa TaxID=63459 RepID=UPI000B778BCF|nr:glutaredoxin-C9-like [Chenopodium quinoa]
MAMVKELKMAQEIGNNNNNSNGMMVMMYDKVKGVVGESAVVVFSSSDCCMCHVAKRLLFSLGVGPTVIELDSDKGSAEIQAVLYQLSGEHQPLPAIFVGGKFLGGIESLMASHINGSLVPLLKEAGALWL